MPTKYIIRFNHVYEPSKEETPQQVLEGVLSGEIMFGGVDAVEILEAEDGTLLLTEEL